MSAAFFFFFSFQRVGLLDMRSAVPNILWASVWQCKHAYLIPYPSHATLAEADSCCQPVDVSRLSLNCISLQTPPSSGDLFRLSAFKTASVFSTRQSRSRARPTAARPSSQKCRLTNC